jgi:hypothetical protein
VSRTRKHLDALQPASPKLAKSLISVDQIVRLPHPDRSSFERADSNRRFFDGMRPESDAHRCDFHAMPLAVECRYAWGPRDDERLGSIHFDGR